MTSIQELEAAGRVCDLGIEEACLLRCSVL